MSAPKRGERGYVPASRDPEDERRYAVTQELRSHHYDTDTTGSRPDDPGWHPCRCGRWEGYWCDFYDEHLAVEILAALRAHEAR